MRITVINQTRSCTLADQCEVADTFWSRFMGLMGRAGLEPGHALLIYPEWSIHTFFMRFPIDVLFLNASEEIVGMRVAMPPNRPFAGVWGAHYVIELPPDVITATGTQPGDQLALEPSPRTTQKKSHRSGQHQA